VHGYGDGADDRGAGGGDVKSNENYCEQQECKITAEPFFGQTEEDTDDQDFGDGGVDEGIPEIRQEGQEGSGRGDSEDVRIKLNEDDGGCESGAQEDPAGQEPGDVAGGEFGHAPFFVSLVEEDVDGADKEGEDSAGDGVFIGLGEGG